MRTQQLPTDAVVPNSQNGAGTVAGYMRFLKELKKDITPEQWAAMAAAGKAADQEDCCVEAHAEEPAAHPR